MVSCKKWPTNITYKKNNRFDERQFNQYMSLNVLSTEGQSHKRLKPQGRILKPNFHKNSNDRILFWSFKNSTSSRTQIAQLLLN